MWKCLHDGLMDLCGPSRVSQIVPREAEGDFHTREGEGRLEK